MISRSSPVAFFCMKSHSGLPLRKPRLPSFGYMPEDRKKEGILEELPVQRNISLPSLADLSRWFNFIQFSQERRLAQQEVQELDIKTPFLHSWCAT